MISQRENKILRKAAEKITDIKSAEVQTLIKKMAEAMFAEPDGVGIAAPQIGAGLQIFLAAKDFLRSSISRGKTSEVFGDLTSEVEEREIPPRKKEYLAFINPVIKKFSQKKIKGR